MHLKDIVKITIFSIIGFIIMMLGSAVSVISGVFAAYLQTAIGSLLTAPIYFVMCRRIKARGTVFLFFLINGIIYTIMGFWPMILIFLAAGIIAELAIGKKENYSSNKRIGISYILGEMVQAFHGVIFMMVLGVQGSVEQFPEMFTQESAQQMYDLLANMKGISLVFILQLIFSLIGVYFGSYIYNKFFDKSVKSQGILK